MKTRNWRAEMERKWEREPQEWIAAHGGHMPKIDSFERFYDEDDGRYVAEGLYGKD